MISNYHPVYPYIFSKYNYSWEDLDLEIYSKILKEEGYPNSFIKEEVSYLRNLFTLGKNLV